ncbi:hypothetical protein [Streptomyces lavendulae]
MLGLVLSAQPPRPHLRGVPDGVDGVQPGRDPVEAFGEGLCLDGAVVEGDGGLEVVFGHGLQQRCLHGG